jgi:glutamine amidotransferase
VDPIAIIDYGAGNLRSVQKAFEHLGHDALITSDADAIARAPALVFPGQGASPPAMAAVNSTGMGDAVRRAIQEGKPFFGVCLGLQLLLDWSEEGATPCLGILSGTVKRLPIGIKIPHMGWNSVHVETHHPLFEGVPQDSHFYFVHSYYADPQPGDVVLGTTDYGVQFCSVAARQNIVATQFHPEKSGPVGLQLYDNFVRRLVYREAASAR